MKTLKRKFPLPEEEKPKLKSNKNAKSAAKLRSLEEEAAKLVPWTLDLDDEGSSSDLEKETKSLKISDIATPSNKKLVGSSSDEMNSENCDEEKETDTIASDEDAGSGKEENMEVNELPTTSKEEEEDYQKEFKVLGQTEFEPLKKINVTTSWVSNATLFPAEIIKENLADLSCVDGLPEPIAKIVKKKIDSWFPVQVSNFKSAALQHVSC
ncbi:unnamed protein product [Strongylus vulgaris]|uniref:Uncharacterized protein n=1 Tax=Strongylus vulgaris TaxID=40348 RepID=A0A3P7L963_STRVU|nr:unnamed protein product [Strongylus vulgaris]